MSRLWHRLSTVKINALTRRGYHADGAGLYLRIIPSGAKSWAFRFRDGGRLREAGLGGYPEISLKRARELAAECRDWRQRGIDPIAARRAKRAATSAPSFKEAAEAYIAAHAPGWRNPKHRQQWRNTLDTYAYPIVGNVPVDAIETRHVLQVLSPIWTSKTETATRLRGRIESILDAARAQGHRAGENPARWRGHLDTLLARPSRVRVVKHHAALPYASLPAFMAALRQQEGVAALALQFAILSAARTGEVLGARWEEIDGDIWTVPAERMKARREHRVPLSSAALAILAGIPRVGPFVFPGRRLTEPMSNAAMTMLLRRMGRPEITVHGFRSTFRDWAREQTSFPRDVCEAALAHATTDKVEAAYLRGDALDLRRRLMEEFATKTIQFV